MSEWWAVWSSYRPSDFLLFSSRTYYRLFELYNADIWPLQIVTLVGGCRDDCAGAQPHRVAWPFDCSIARCVLAVGRMGFPLAALRNDQLGGELFRGWICDRGAAAGLDRNRARRAQVRCEQRRTPRIGIAIFSFAVLVQPMIGLLLGRAWSQLEVFGVTPDPTVVATLGLLLAAKRIAWIALPIPLLWCIVSGTTLSVMNAADALILPAVAGLVLLLVFTRNNRRV